LHGPRDCHVSTPRFVIVTHMSALAYTRRGRGAPLVLLHALGSSRQAWNPVLPALAEQFDVIAVDLPGFGDSVPLPPDVEPHPPALAAAVVGLLQDLEITRPHIAGNSLGGWIALELAGLQPVASLTLLSPAGLWRDNTPMYCLASLRATRYLAEHATPLVRRLVRNGLGRILILGQTHGRPVKMSVEQAHLAIHTLGACPGFEATLRATAERRYRGGPPRDAPVTIAFGSRDFILLPHQSRFLDQLPPDTHHGSLPLCGHVPMADNPPAVTKLIVESAARARRWSGAAPTLGHAL
jgi:pimeloyl-ACP methyl ester carboxylesterase